MGGGGGLSKGGGGVGSQILPFAGGGRGNFANLMRERGAQLLPNTNYKKLK